MSDPDIDPRTREALRRWRERSRVPPRQEAVGRARRALEAALAASPPRRPWWHRASAGAGLLAACAGAAVLALGWDAPAGNPLHPIRVAHEQVTLAISGDRAHLEVAYARDRLSEAVKVDNARPSLEEAHQLLQDARRHMGESPPPADQRELEAVQRQIDVRAAAVGGNSAPEATPSPVVAVATTPSPVPPAPTEAATPAPAAVVSPTPAPSQTSAATVAPAPDPTLTPTPDPTPQPAPDPSPTPTKSPSPTVQPDPTPAPDPSPTNDPPTVEPSTVKPAPVNDSPNAAPAKRG